MFSMTPSWAYHKQDLAQGNILSGVALQALHIDEVGIDMGDISKFLRLYFVNTAITASGIH